MTSYRRVQKESDELLYTVRSLVIVRETVATSLSLTRLRKRQARIPVVVRELHSRRSGVLVVERASFERGINGIVARQRERERGGEGGGRILRSSYGTTTRSSTRRHGIRESCSPSSRLRACRSISEHLGTTGTTRYTRLCVCVCADPT